MLLIPPDSGNLSWYLRSGLLTVVLNPASSYIITVQCLFLLDQVVSTSPRIMTGNPLHFTMGTQWHIYFLRRVQCSLTCFFMKLLKSYEQQTL